MARYIGPVCRLCRREKMKLFLKGAKCLMSKCPVEKGRKPPGEHGLRRRKVSEYGVQLREKQKLRRSFLIGERQFRNYYEKAALKKGMTGENLLKMLETRLDNVIYRLGFTPAIRTARQFVLHGHIQVNGRRVDFPGYAVKVGDIVEVRKGSTSRQRAAEALEASHAQEVPEWLHLDKNQFRGEALRLPTINEGRVPVDISLVVGLYSK
ncbi:MAG: 30S ribosomal protein S4 [Candidatus Euphemobacter frigidus]|nr:30S ribosomal protein S4 [Candidatus Euphemobacter frigidus]MDP8276179.1 30S ribosomal protein S4 [Candidatus Euphemobacter frigidus]